jgi:HSP20 family molecular chaperone IbpA
MALQRDEGWKNLKDVDRVYHNPNIDDQTLWSPRLGTSFCPPPQGSTQPIHPADLFEEEAGHLLVEVELPGVPKEDIGLELNEDEQEGFMFLTIAALKPQRAKEESGASQPPPRYSNPHRPFFLQACTTLRRGTTAASSGR